MFPDDTPKARQFSLRILRYRLGRSYIGPLDLYSTWFRENLLASTQAGLTGRSATLRLSGLTNDEKQLMADLFSLKKQQARGSWSSQAKIAGRLGRLHFSHHLMKHGKYFHESVESDTYRSVSAEASPEALLAHTVLDPMLSSFYEPFVLRSSRAFPPSFDDSPEKVERFRERRRTRWQEVDAFFAALDLGVEPELSAVRPGGVGPDCVPPSSSQPRSHLPTPSGAVRSA